MIECLKHGRFTPVTLLKTEYAKKKKIFTLENNKLLKRGHVIFTGGSHCFVVMKKNMNLVFSCLATYPAYLDFWRMCDIFKNRLIGMKCCE